MESVVLCVEMTLYLTVSNFDELLIEESCFSWRPFTNGFDGISKVDRRAFVNDVCNCSKNL